MRPEAHETGISGASGAHFQNEMTDKEDIQGWHKTAFKS